MLFIINDTFFSPYKENQFGDEGVLALAEAIRRNSSLEKLWLHCAFCQNRPKQKNLSDIPILTFHLK